jgi:hypothetical protein
MSELHLQSPHAIQLPNNSALAAGIRVRLSAGYLVAAGADENDIGRMAQTVAADEATAPVLYDGPGLRQMVAAGAVDLYAEVFRAASGKVSATPSGVAPYGLALSATGGGGGAINVLPYGSPPYVAS